MKVRRVVTGVGADGRSRIVSDGVPPRTHDFETIPEHASSLLWATDTEPPTPSDGEDPTPTLPSVIRGPGETTFMTVQFPPDSVFAADDFDPEAAHREQTEVTPGLLEHFEEPGSPFHRTPTVDYVLLLEGELWLIVDEGEVKLEPGDIVVQNGTRHAWENRTDKPARIVATIVSGAPRAA